MKEPLAFFREAVRDSLQADQATTPESLARLASASFDLGSLTDEIGNKQDALAVYQESRTIRQKLAADNPGVTKSQTRPGRLPQQRRQPAARRPASRPKR